MKKTINELLKIFGIGEIVVLGWQALELVITGEITPNKVDSTIWIILTYSLYGNLKTWNSKEGEKSNC